MRETAVLAVRVRGRCRVTARGAPPQLGHLPRLSLTWRSEPQSVTCTQVTSDMGGPPRGP